MTRTGLPPRARAAGVAVVAAALFAIDAVLVGVRVGWLVGWDATVSRHAVQAVHAHPWLLTAARAVTQLGNPVGVDIVVAVLAVALLARRQWSAGVAVLLARLVGLGVEQLCKAVIDRPRPTTLPPVATAAGSSFPSGHSTGAASVAAVAAVLLVVLTRSHRRLVVGGVAVLAVLALAVATSRVLLVVHYPTDVLGGLLLGLASGTAAVAVLPVARRGVSSNRPEP